MYQNLFEKVKLQPKKLYFQHKLKQYKNNIKNIIILYWQVYNDITDKKQITDKETIAEKFKSYYINLRSNLATKIPSSDKNFES